MKLIPYLTYGDTISMQVILDYFSRFLNFEEYDNNPLPEHSLYLDSFCAITEGISSDDSGDIYIILCFWTLCNIFFETFVD